MTVPETIRLSDGTPVTARELPGLRGIEAALCAAGLGPVAGVDEAGRGACAGPIAIGACILPDEDVEALAGLTDSKKLSPAARARLYPAICESALAWSVILIDAPTIDAKGIQWANIDGMRQAVATLDPHPATVLLDAMVVPGLGCPSASLIKGDSRARCIAAASVLAKHTRDEWMIRADADHPGYGFAAHKGYGTKSHTDAVRRQGASPIHRYTYANIAAAHAHWLSATGQPGGEHTLPL